VYLHVLFCVCFCLFVVLFCFVLLLLFLFCCCFVVVVVGILFLFVVVVVVVLLFLFCCCCIFCLFLFCVRHHFINSHLPKNVSVTWTLLSMIGMNYYNETSGIPYHLRPSCSIKPYLTISVNVSHCGCVIGNNTGYSKFAKENSGTKVFRGYWDI
jgi:hypothetical protein